MTWRTGKPPQGDWIVIATGTRHMTLAYYRPDMGWCVHGRWQGHEAVVCWHEPPAWPKDFDKLAKGS